MAEEVTNHPLIDVVVTQDAPVVERKLERTVGGGDHCQPFRRNDARNLDHCVAISSAVAAVETTDSKKVDAEEVLARFFMIGYDLNIRAKLAPQLEARVEGPGKQIDKAAKALAAALGITEQEAREQVVAGRVARGLPV